MNKRIIASILTVIMLMTMLPTAAFAADGESIETGNSTTLETAIYLDQQHGADDKDGLSEATAVKTIEKANELANANNINDICLSSFYQVTGTETWDLGGKTLHRYKGGYMIELADASASLTLSNIVIDGAATHAAETDSIIKAANGGTIVLNSGAILQNNKAAQFGSGILANNGVNITMEDGAIIRNNTNSNYELGGGILIGNGSTFTMNGGEISGNTANGGGGVAIIGSTMVMNDGVISNNSTYRTSGQGSYGAGVYVADYANASGGDTLFTATPASFEMNGGTITGNTALDYGGGVLTFPQRSQKITININNGEISGNKVTEGSGGAVAAFFGETELNINGGTLTKNSALNNGGGVFLWQATNVTISGGTISENKASAGGGVCLYTDSAVTQTGGSIENNVANVGGGVCGGTYTMTGGVIKDNNNSLAETERLAAKGDGVYVGTAFNLGNDAEISTNNDVYLVQGTSVPKEGRYINVISPYTGASNAKPIQIHSEDRTVENTEIGTQLVQYTNAAGGETAAAQADVDGIFVPSWKMPEGLVIGQSKAAGKTDWMTYVPNKHGDLTVTKTVDGTAGDTSKAFNFTVTLKDTGINGTFGEMTFTDGAATFALKHGESKTAKDLPAGITYTVTEAEADQDGYTTTAANASGSIIKDDTAAVTFTNTRNSSSSHHSTRYTLHYESNGGTAYKDERYSSGTKVTLDKTPTRESYTFTGWYADKALTQKITSVTMNSDKTVYAGWEATGVPDKLNGDDHFAYVIGYPDGKVHPKGNISRAETATIFFRLLKADIRDGNLTADNDFSDVSDSQWHNKAISTMAKLGIVKGRRADSFDPDASITRAEFAAICARFNTKPVENSGSFSDISGHWAENEIERAAAFGWISGYPDGTFRPDARITRAEAMTMINRVLCRMPQSKSDLLDSMVTWPDNKPSDWHYLAVQEATNSHDFNRQGEVGESWTKLTSVPDWKRYQ
ncbi:hypothetical protein DWY17_10860 [Butyricicoccus sp. AF24-19AC]|nr:S-layer homology domain-containing protein [Butyricicoccus sp. AF24-19AC]RHQ68723.1 hypothetical protein DWY17_10860 [Butyricicoccus sp. AF24-19AC]